MNKAKERNKRASKLAKLKLPYLTYLLVIVAVFATGLTYSRMKLTVSGNDSINLARPVMVLQRDNYTDELDEEDTGIYYFCVKNFDANGRTEIALDYEIAPDYNDDYAGTVTFKLYRSDSTYTDKTEITGVGGIFGDSNMTCGILSDETHYYILEYTPDTEGNLTVTVNINTAQVV